MPKDDPLIDSSYGSVSRLMKRGHQILSHLVGAYPTNCCAGGQHRGPYSPGRRLIGTGNRRRQPIKPIKYRPFVG